MEKASQASILALIALGVICGLLLSGMNEVKAQPSPSLISDLGFTPSGWRGDWRDITFNSEYPDSPYERGTCIKIDYSAAQSGGNGWAGVYWLYPDSNQGDKPGKNLVGYSRVTFWARGDRGGEMSDFKVGGSSGSDSIQPAISTGAVTLSNEWQPYTIDLSGKDLSNVIGGFYWGASKGDNPYGCTVYLYGMRFE